MKKVYSVNKEVAEKYLEAARYLAKCFREIEEQSKENQRGGE